MPSAADRLLKRYGGVVIASNDPEQRGRLKVRVPLLHGINAQTGTVTDDQLPWASPEGLPAGCSNESGGVSWLPIAGDQVWISFLDNDPSKLVWAWGNQHRPGKAAWGKRPLHAYEANGSAIRRAAFSRFEHWTELRPWGIDVWTKSGYHFEVVDQQDGQNSGRLTWRTPEGFTVSLDDALRALNAYADNIEIAGLRAAISASEEITLTTGTLNLDIGQLMLGGGYKDFEIDVTERAGPGRGLKVTANHLGTQLSDSSWLSAKSFQYVDGPLTYDSQNKAGSNTLPTLVAKGDSVYLGKAAADPVVRLSDLIAALAEVKALFDAHVHKGVKPGGGLTQAPSKKARFRPTGSAKVMVETRSKVRGAVG